MKNFYSKPLLLLVAALFVFNFSKATNVSGGIYSNTTWTLANSPYIVTSNIVVFPGVTLTIQPGVVVKFDNNTQIEIRLAKLIAVGTAIDSITFTSNSGSPTPGIYRGIFLNGDTLATKFSSFHYCSFSYADTAIYSIKADTISVQNSFFGSNANGFIDLAGVTTVTNSNFSGNTTDGLFLENLETASISACNFLYNGVGLTSDFFKLTTTNCLFEHNFYGLSCEYLHLTNSVVNNNKIGAYSNSVNVFENSTFDSNSITGIYTVGDSVIHCTAYYNAIGIETGSSTILNSDIEHNTTSSISEVGGWGGSVVTGNILKYSGVGIDNVYDSFYIASNDIEYNNIGIKLSKVGTITCNTLCNNTSYALYYDGGPNNLSVKNNYWCTSDSAHTQALIYDGYINISYGLAFFMPIDTVPCAFFCSNNHNQDICIVTTDTAINKNVIIWGRNNLPPNNATSFVNIYDSTVSGWVKIATVADTALSQYVDVASNPSAKAYSYKISTVDSCGESSLSPTNTSIYLQVALLSGRDSLYWTAYVGFGTPKYYIYRGLALNALTLIDSVSGSTLNYVDVLPPAGSIYLIEAVNPGGPCIPSHGINRFLVNTNASISNGGVPKAPAGVNGINGSGASVHIYPNPNNGQFTIQIATSYQLSAISSVVIYNMMGQQIYSNSQITKSSNYQIDLGAQPNGVYMYRILTQAGDLVSDGKFIIEK